MFALYKKELASFFSSLMGYLTIVVFLILTGLMMWVFHFQSNVLDFGFAGIDPLFAIAPFLYLFLIPAITMRSLAEEKLTGTIELLLTNPLSETTIIVAKFLAGWTMVFISLLPTLVYYVSVYLLGDPVGNIDTGGVIGSYIGMLFLGGAFVAIGIFSSSISNNQIVSFIIAALLCAISYMGFEMIYGTQVFGKAGLVLRQLGIQYHYESISRGVIDTRDVIYFVSVMAIFLMATRSVMLNRVKRPRLIEFGALIVIAILLNIMGQFLFGRIDLTAEKRYTLSKSTKEMLKKVDEPVLFRIYLEGNSLPGEYQRLQNETREMLNQFRAYNKNVEYEFVDVSPSSFESQGEAQAFYKTLAQNNIQPASVQTQTKDGVIQQVLIPAASVNYKGRETYVQLMHSQLYMSEAEAMNNSIQDLEYVLSNAIRNLSRALKPKIGFLLGHGELERGAVYDIQMSLTENYRMENVYLEGNINALTGRNRSSKDSTMTFFNKFDVLVIAKPVQPFTDQELYLIDQYVMYGGHILWLVDGIDASMDSLQDKDQAIAIRYPTNLDEMFFNYGVRINPDVIMDVRCRPIPMVVGQVGNKPQIKYCPWYYFPEIIPISQHPIVRNLDLIKTDFVSSIDLIENNIQKTILLTSSDYSRVKNAPAIIDLAESKMELDQRQFNKSRLPVAVLMEGNFRSMWRSRLAPSFTEIPEMGYRDTGDYTSMIVISDGDMIKNRFSYEEGSSYPLGYDNYTQTMYANKQFLMNCIDYLAGNEESLATRSRDIKLRKLNAMKVKEQGTLYAWINLLIPVAMVLIGGAIYLVIRKHNLKKRK